MFTDRHVFVPCKFPSSIIARLQYVREEIVNDDHHSSLTIYFTILFLVGSWCVCVQIKVGGIWNGDPSRALKKRKLSGWTQPKLLICP